MACDKEGAAEEAGRRRDGGGGTEAGRRRDGGGTEAASTKSQTRTPHKDVGQNMLVIALEIKSV